MPVFASTIFILEVLMKKILTLFAIIFAVFICCIAAACSNKKPETAVVITAQDDNFEFDGKTLKDYMDFLQENEKLTYSISNGMVTAINGKSNTTNSYWMLYTNDSENANSSWGTYEYEGATYGSATLGAEELVVKENCVYIWAYQTF